MGVRLRDNKIKNTNKIVRLQSRNLDSMLQPSAVVSFCSFWLLFLLCLSSSYAQRHHIAVSYSEPVDNSALELSNYTVFDVELNEISVLNVWLLSDSVYAVVVDFLDYKSNFSIRAENIKDLVGNYINENNSAWFYFDGYDINEPQPYLIVR